MQMVLLIGIPASGKSTFCKQRLFDSHVRINRDMLGTKHREAVLIEACLAVGQGLVIDNTNITREVRAKYTSMAREHGFSVVGYYFQSKINDCLARNNERSSKQRVPAKAVLGMHAKLELPSYDEGFNQLYYVIIDDGGFQIQDWNMRFSDFQKTLKEYEKPFDTAVPPGDHLVVRLDGRDFTRLTNKIMEFEKPFDARFHDLILETLKHLMQCGPRVVYAYTQSDEISLLLADENSFFNRRVQKICSVLAGEASAAFTLKLGQVASFDCRISQLPDSHAVINYFRWRQEDARRNALNAYCYWSLRRNNTPPDKADDLLSGMTRSTKLELLRRKGVDFLGAPAWQTNGTGGYWQQVTKQGVNQLTGEATTYQRNELIIDTNLPNGKSYAEFIGDLLEP